MAFSDDEIAAHAALIEKRFWSRRRPPLAVRAQVREGQRIEGSTIELFYSRPAFGIPGEWIEESIVRLRYFPRLKVWRIYWQRSDLKWYAYEPQSELPTLSECLRLVDEDAYGCFFG